jgi:hypothetical protein
VLPDVSAFTSNFITNYLTTGSSKLFVAEKLLVVSIGLENPTSAGAVAVLETSPF